MLDQDLGSVQLSELNVKNPTMNLDRPFIFREFNDHVDTVMKMGSDGLFVMVLSNGLVKVWSSHDAECKRTSSLSLYRLSVS